MQQLEGWKIGPVPRTRKAAASTLAWCSKATPSSCFCSPFARCSNLFVRAALWQAGKTELETTTTTTVTFTFTHAADYHGRSLPRQLWPLSSAWLQCLAIIPAAAAPGSQATLKFQPNLCLCRLPFHTEFLQRSINEAGQREGGQCQIYRNLPRLSG